MSTCTPLMTLGTCLTDPLDTPWRLAPDDAKPFKIDASLWLDTGDTLTSNIVITVPPPLLVGDGQAHPAPINSTTIITFWLYNASSRHRYAVNIQFTTANGITHTVSNWLRGGY